MWSYICRYRGGYVVLYEGGGKKIKKKEIKYDAETRLSMKTRKRKQGHSHVTLCSYLIGGQVANRNLANEGDQMMLAQAANQN